MNAVMPGHSQFPPYNGVGLLPPEEGMDNLPPYNNNDNGTPHHHRPNSFGSNENPVPDNPNNGRVNNHHSGAITNNGGGGNIINGKAGSENPMATIPKHHSTSSAPPDYQPQQQYSNPPMSPPQRQMRSHQQQHLSPMGSPMGVPLPTPSPGANSPVKGYGPNGVGVGLPMTPQFGLGVPSVPQQPQLFHDPLAASFPWSIGTTDGSFALVNLQQQQQQILMQQRQQEIERRQKQQQQQLQQQQEQLQQQQEEDVPTEIKVDNALPSDPTQRSSILDTGGSSELTMHTKPPPSPAIAKRVAAAAAQEPPPPNPEIQKAQAAIAQSAAVVQQGRSLYHDQLFHQSSSSVEGVLAASCDVMGFDIAEMWLRTGLKTHQLTNSHLRPTALQDSVRQDLVEVYYGDKSNERTHRLSPALCKRAKDANDVVWVTAHTQTGAEALRMSISNVRTAVAVPLCHEASNTNVTILYFSMRRIVLRPASVEFLIHMSLSAAVASVNALSTDGLIDRPDGGRPSVPRLKTLSAGATSGPFGENLSKTTDGVRSKPDAHAHHRSVAQHRRADKTSITGARLDLQWKQLLNAEYLTDGGNSWIHTAVYDGKPVVVKTLRPECQDTAVAINEIESEVAVHARLNHPNIVSLVGAGHTKRNVRFIVLERLDGGTLTQMLGYDTRIRDRRRRFWRKKQLPYLDVLRCARSLACAMQYCHEKAIPGSMVLHRDLKPDNIGFTLDGQVKLLDFGLARILENSDPSSNERYEMSGETGSLRYMAPEVAEGLPYNHKADVYSFGIIFWEMNAGKRPFNNLSRDTFYEQVVHGCGRPHLSKKWPSDLTKLISDCWNVDVDARPTFGQVVDRIDDLLTNEKGGKNTPTPGKKAMQSISRIIDRHSTWF